MIWNVKYTVTHTDRSAYIRRGKEIYRHPQNYFVVLEFHGRIGNFREAYRPDELMKVV